MGADFKPVSDQSLRDLVEVAPEHLPGMIASELLARRAAMAHADSLGMDVDRIARLICPPPCETCGGTGRVPGVGVIDEQLCPDCHGRPKWTLHDRLDTLRAALDNNLELREDSDYTIEAILADVAEVTP